MTKCDPLLIASRARAGRMLFFSDSRIADEDARALPAVPPEEDQACPTQFASAAPKGSLRDSERKVHARRVPLRRARRPTISQQTQTEDPSSHAARFLVAICSLAAILGT
jgi:hypothetical protein